MKSEEVRLEGKVVDHDWWVSVPTMHLRADDEHGKFFVVRLEETPECDCDFEIGDELEIIVRKKHCRVVQLVERRSLKPKVVGSSPTPASKTTDSMIDDLYDYIDDRLRKGKFDHVSGYLNGLMKAMEALDTDWIIAVLTITHAAKDKLYIRAEFLKRAEEVLKQRPEWDENLLKGF